MRMMREDRSDVYSEMFQELEDEFNNARGVMFGTLYGGPIDIEISEVPGLACRPIILKEGIRFDLEDGNDNDIYVKITGNTRATIYDDVNDGFKIHNENVGTLYFLRE